MQASLAFDTRYRLLMQALGRRLGAAAAAFVLGLLLLARHAEAAAPAQPSLELTVHRVVAAQGGEPERLAGAETARAGDTLEYVAVYRNTTARTVHNAQVTLPIPPGGIEYLLDSALPAARQASSDGRSFAALPLMRPAAGPDGKPVLRAAPASDYRFLRWDLGDLPPGGSRTVRARVQLLPVGSVR